MTNLEADPQEQVCVAGPTGGAAIQVLEPRDVPLGGPRAMTVRRTLPQRQRSLIGAWCFVDHYGPDAVGTRGMNVPPHPHTGLQTVSWLFAGGIEHNDSTGAHAMVRPGELNLMTAGQGIQHSEVSVQREDADSASDILHGAQLWVALPDAHRHRSPFFENYVPPVFEHEGAQVRVFLGSLLGHTSTATAFTPIVGAQFDLPANATVSIPVDRSFEHGVLVDAGEITMNGGEAVPVHAIGYRAPGADRLVLTAGETGGRVLLIGGEPLGEQIVMWWNFVGRSHEEVVAYREQWQSEVIEGTTDVGRFGRVHGYTGGSPLAAPVLPTVRLKPRG